MSHSGKRAEFLMKRFEYEYSLPALPSERRGEREKQTSPEWKEAGRQNEDASQIPLPGFQALECLGLVSKVEPIPNGSWFAGRVPHIPFAANLSPLVKPFRKE